jgi:hypothetical protein
LHVPEIIFNFSLPPLNARTAAYCIGALVAVYVSLATAAIAFRSHLKEGGKVNVPSLQPPAPHHLLKPPLIIVPSG